MTTSSSTNVKPLRDERDMDESSKWNSKRSH